MSDLILQWLNTDVGLSKKVKAFERDFSSGYLFGELLSKYGYLGDFEESFKNDSSLSAKAENFSKLSAAFRGPAGGLGVNLKEEQVREIMQEDRGSSLRLLYQLRKGLMQQGQGDSAAKKKVATVARQAKVMRGEHEERFFDEKLTTLRPTDRKVSHEVNAKHFVDEHTQQMRKAAEQDAQAVQDTKNRVQEHRQQRLETMSDKKVEAERKVQDGHATWHGVQTRKATSLAKDLHFEKQMIRREQQKIQKVREEHREETGYAKNDDTSGINWFERNLARIGIDTSEHSGTTGNEIEASNIKELYEKMQEKLPTQAQLQVEASKRMKKIKETKRETDNARKEREKRQLRMHVEQQATQVVVEEQRAEEDELKWLLRVTVDYRKEAAAHDHLQRTKEAARVEREARQTTKAEQVAIEQEEAYQRTAAKAREEREVAKAERAKQKAALGNQDEEETDSDADEEEMEPNADMSQSEASPVSTRRMSRLERMASARSLAQGEEAKPSIAPAKQLLECVQETRVSEYLYARGEWAKHQPAESDVLAVMAEQGDLNGAAAPRLGGLVKWLCEPANTLPEDKADLPLELMPVIALSGCPVGLGLGGSTVLAAVQRRLCEEFELTLLQPSNVLAECMALARTQEPDWPISGRLHALGKKLLALGKGELAPPNLVAEILFRKIELLWAPPPKPVEEEQVDPKKKKPPPKGKKGGEEEGPPPKPKGILLAGFPADFGQQAAFEGALRGYLSPILRLQSGEQDQQLQLSSVIAPWWIEQRAIALSDLQDQEDEDAGAGGGGELEEGEHADGRAALSHGPVAPLQVLRLRHLEHRSLTKAVVAEAADESAWELPARGGEVEGEEVPPLCQGYEKDLASLSSPVDRAWLYQESQILTSAYTAPLGTLHEVASTQKEGESLEDACYRQARELVADWRRRTDQLVAAAAAAAAETKAKAEAAKAAAEAAGEGAEGGDAEAAQDAEVAGVTEPLEESEQLASTELAAPGPWPLVSPQAQERLREAWLRGLSSYYLGVQQTLGQVQQGVASYSDNVVMLQRRFLEFLQRGDEKPTVADDFFRMILQKQQLPQKRAMEDEVAEQMEELSDRLWQLTDRRRFESVEERVRLMTGSSFWEKQADVFTKLAERLQAAEYARFTTAASLLFEAFGCELPPFHTGALPDTGLRVPGSGPTGEPSMLEELQDALHASVKRFAGASILEAAASAVNVAEPQEEMESPRHERKEKELYAALLAEQKRHIQRLQAVASWTQARLVGMRSQLDQAFRRMDDWIKDRVKTENDSIKGSVAFLRGSLLTSKEEEEMANTLNTKSMKRQASRSSRDISPQSKSPVSKIRGQRREFLKILEPRTLDVDLLQPPKTDTQASLATQLPMQGAFGRAAPSLSKDSAAVGERWPQEMICGLMQKLLERCPAGTAVVDGETLLDVLLELRNRTLSFQAECVPRSWMHRSEEAWRLLCQGLVSPAWGSAAVDLTELLLELTFHGRPLPPPSAEALQASRQLILSQEGGLKEETRACYPDVPVCEELFLRLPLWESSAGSEEPGETRDQLLRWLFRVLRCYENEAQPQLLTVPGRSRGDGATGAIAARRLFTYLGRGATPSEGLQLALQLLSPPPPAPRPQTGESEEAPQAADAADVAAPGMKVQDLRAVLFSCHAGRPKGAVAEAPELEDLCKQLLPQLYDKEAFKAAQETAAGAVDPKAKAKAKAKGKGKAEEAPPEEEDVPPPPFEEAVLPMEAAEVLRHPVVLKGLFTHGGALCRKRAISAVFPLQGSGTGPAPVAAEDPSARPVALASLVPPEEPSKEVSPTPP